MITPPLDIEVWADREAELEKLFAALSETELSPDEETQEVAP